MRDRGATWTASGSVHLGDPAAVGAANEEPGCASAGALSAWHLDWRLPGGIGGAVGQGRAEPVAGGDFPADGGVASGLRAWQKRDLSARRYLYVWADGVFLQARMEDHRMHAGADRGHAGGQEGTHRFPGWRS